MEACGRAPALSLYPVGAAVAATVQTGRRCRLGPASRPTVAVTVSGATALMVERAGRRRMPDGASLATDVLRPHIGAAGSPRSDALRPRPPARPTANALALVEAGTRSSSRTAEAGTGRTALRPVPRRAADGEATIALASRPALVHGTGGYTEGRTSKNQVARRRSRAAGPRGVRTIRDGGRLPGLDVPGRGVPAGLHPALGARLAGRASRRPGRLRLDGGGAPAEGLPGIDALYRRRPLDRHR